MGGQTVKLDTGAEANVLPQSIAIIMHRQHTLKKTNTVLEAYGGSRIKPKGILTLHVNSQHKQALLHFYVTRHCLAEMLV